MVKCTDCGKEIPEGHDLSCDMCGAPLCEECGTTGLCFHVRRTLGIRNRLRGYGSRRGIAKTKK